jgi:hypothetical protein
MLFGQDGALDSGQGGLAFAWVFFVSLEIKGRLWSLGGLLSYRKRAALVHCG